MRSHYIASTAAGRHGLACAAGDPSTRGAVASRHSLHRGGVWSAWRLGGAAPTYPGFPGARRGTRRITPPPPPSTLPRKNISMLNSKYLIYFVQCSVMCITQEGTVAVVMTVVTAAVVLNREILFGLRYCCIFNELFDTGQSSTPSETLKTNRTL